jgi:Amidase
MPRRLGALPRIKDCFEVAGLVTSVGAPALQNYIPREDASAVARLRRAGAIILGKTNVPLLTGDFQASSAGGIFKGSGAVFRMLCRGAVSASSHRRDPALKRPIRTRGLSRSMAGSGHILI